MKGQLILSEEQSINAVTLIYNFHCQMNKWMINKCMPSHTHTQKLMFTFFWYYKMCAVPQNSSTAFDTEFDTSRATHIAFNYTDNYVIHAQNNRSCDAFYLLFIVLHWTHTPRVCAPNAKNSANTRNAEHAVIECEFLTNLILSAVIAFYLVNPALGIPIQNKICPIERVQNWELTESIWNWLNSVIPWGQLINFDQYWKVSCSFSKAVRTNIDLAFKLQRKSPYV